MPWCGKYDDAWCGHSECVAADAAVRVRQQADAHGEDA